MEFVIYLQSIINSYGVCNLFAINYQYHMKVVTDLQSIINSNEIGNLFAINYQFRWNL